MFLGYYFALVWFGASVESASGFQLGGRTYLAPGADGGIGRTIEDLIDAIWWPLREPILRLPVLVPMACAAAGFATVDHRAGSVELAKQVEPAILAMILAVLAINGLLSRGQAVIDYIAAGITIMVLAGAEALALVEVSENGMAEVNWLTAGMVFGFVTMLISGVRGATPPDPQPAATRYKVRTVTGREGVDFDREVTKALAGVSRADVAAVGYSSRQDPNDPGRDIPSALIVLETPRPTPPPELRDLDARDWPAEVSVIQVADFLSVTPRQVRTMIAHGRFEARKVGNVWRITSMSLRPSADRR